MLCWTGERRYAAGLVRVLGVRLLEKHACSGSRVLGYRFNHVALRSLLLSYSADGHRAHVQILAGTHRLKMLMQQHHVNINANNFAPMPAINLLSFC